MDVARDVVGAGPREGVREAARGGVSLEHEHALAGVLGEQRGAREPADARADHDRVPGPIELAG